MEPELIADYGDWTGEGPLWHPTEKRLYWVDIPRGRIYRYEPATGEHGLFYEVDSMVGGITFQADGSMLLFMSKGGIGVLRDGKLEYIFEQLPGEDENRFNDVFTDSRGRVFCGTMPLDPTRGAERLGTLYRLETDGSTTKVLERLGIANGMGLTPDRTQMYFTDTIDRTIYRFDYDADTGDISNRRVFVKTTGDGLPDGMTVDSEGFVWSARWGGWGLFRYSPEGVEERRVQFPAEALSSVIFGGDDYTDMYVTTARGESGEQSGSGAGALFRINLGIKGAPEFFSRVGL